MIRQYTENDETEVEVAIPLLSTPMWYKRRARILYAIIGLTLLYILVSYDPVPAPAPAPVPAPVPEPVPVLAHSPKKLYDDHPTYEYVSLYRQKADPAFEAALDEKLRALEQETINSLPKDVHELATNLTIWQLTTQAAADAFPLWTAQWRDNNQDWGYKLFTSPPVGVSGHFKGIPEIAGMKSTLTGVQDDLMRYLLLWYHGGFYAAVETWDRVALRDCSPLAAVLGHQKEVSLMVGVDTDEPFLSDEALRERKWARGVGFGKAAMWAAMRFDPILRKAIVRTVSHARLHDTLTQNEMRKENPVGKTGHAGEISGNGMFTDVVLETLSASLKDDHKIRDREAGLERRVTWKNFRNLKEIVWIEKDQVKEGLENDMRGLAVLPINVWGSGKSHSKSGTFEHPEACLNHMPNLN